MAGRPEQYSFWNNICYCSSLKRHIRYSTTPRSFRKDRYCIHNQVLVVSGLSHCRGLWVLSHLHRKMQNHCYRCSTPDGRPISSKVNDAFLLLVEIIVACT